jgi:hypothetical protein
MLAMSEKAKAAPPGPARRPYVTPRVRRLGTLTELTAQNALGTGMNDGGAPGPHKTG